MNKLTRMAALVVIAGLLGACGAKGDADLTVGLPNGPAADGGGGKPAPVTDDGGPVNPGPAPPACELLSLEDLAGTLGNPVRAGSGEGRNCFWGTRIDGGTSVFLSVTKPGSPAQCNIQRDALPKEAKQEPVSGVGTSAVWIYQELNLLLQGSILACYSDSIVSVQVTGEKGQDMLRTTAINLAQKVHANL